MRLARFMPLYTVLWHLLLPAVLLYLAWRGRRDPLYARHLGERFGRYRARMEGCVWIHAVSLGEVRSAMPLARALLARGERVVMTHFTPAGRREASRVLAPEIASGRAASVWIPFDTSWAFAGFFRAFRPRAGLVMEVEHWPRMILAARAAGVPLYPCNAQYPQASFEADRRRRRWRAEAIARYAGAFVKSELQAQRFAATGLDPVVVTGETRFDQPVPPALVAAGRAAREALAGGRMVVTLASTVEGEDDIYLRAIRILRRDLQARGQGLLAVWVPRRPERFAEVGGRIAAAGLRLARRSQLLAPDFGIVAQAPETDVLLGDSLGEMYAYLAMADRVVVGGGFTRGGAHNIIEPLVLGRAVVTGPVTWPIEYPFAEAAAAGLAQTVPDAEGLAAALAAPPLAGEAAAAAFVAAHSGAAARTLAALDRLTRR